MILYNIVWTTKWIGMALIVLCWIQAIPLRFGWIGFGVALVSFVVERLCEKQLSTRGQEKHTEERSTHT